MGGGLIRRGVVVGERRPGNDAPVNTSEGSGAPLNVLNPNIKLTL